MSSGGIERPHFTSVRPFPLVNSKGAKDSPELIPSTITDFVWEMSATQKCRALDKFTTEEY